ncbi:hypothetical protein BpHYR1_052197 [Brachionus plicatilis]|uniref:Uncharacterized protein n=1 Tax=Brachionus plicatilis TaxID=10195 RepID=A0A3M7S4L7_BRAPC|nr:hypothetical protein BpHYR1_052197 [Brachionus plicatilis]
MHFEEIKNEEHVLFENPRIQWLSVGNRIGSHNTNAKTQQIQCRRHESIQTALPRTQLMAWRRD